MLEFCTQKFTMSTKLMAMLFLLNTNLLAQNMPSRYHAWLILPTETGCKVITDESQNGWLTFFEKTFQPKKLKKLHDVWLTELKKKAEASKP